MVPRRALAQSQRTGQGVAAAADHLTLASSAAPDLTTHACHATRTRTNPHAAPAPRLYRIRQSTRCGARLWQEVAQQRGRIRVVAKHHRAVSRDRARGQRMRVRDSVVLRTRGAIQRAMRECFEVGSPPHRV